MRPVLPSPTPSRPEPGPAAAGAAPGAAGARAELALALLVALVPVALYARTLAWPALEFSDEALRSAGSLRAAAEAGGPGGASLFLEGLAESALAESATVPRAVALLLHAGASALAFVLARTLGATRAASVVVALLFAVHPLQVESVAWLSQRGTLLGGFLFLLGACLSLRGGLPRAHAPSRTHTKHTTPRAYAVGGALLTALVCEPRLLGGVLWLVLTERWVLHKRQGRPRLAFNLALVFGYGWLLLESTSDGFASNAPAMLERWAGSPRALAALLGHALVPVGLTPHHGPPGAPSAWLALAWLVLGLTLAWLLRLGKRRPLPALGMLLFLLLGLGHALFPRGADLFRESDAYLALFGLALLAAGETRARPRLALGAVLVLACAARTHAWLDVWRSEPALQTAALAARPGDPAPHATLARWYARRGQLSAAQAAAEQALAREPRNAAVLQQLGEIELRRAGIPGQEARVASAREIFERCLRHPGAPPEAYERLAELFALQGEPEQARATLQRLLSEDPERATAQVRFARLLLERQELEGAETALARAAELDPDAPEAWSGLGIVAFQRGHLEEARRHFERALALEPDWIEANALLGRIHETEQRLAPAERHYRRALSIAPDRPDALQVDTLYALGALLAGAGRGHEALPFLERVVVLRADPPHVRAHLASAELRLARGDRALAERLVAAVLAFNPEHPEARALRERLESEAQR